MKRKSIQQRWPVVAMAWHWVQAAEGWPAKEMSEKPQDEANGGGGERK